MTQVFLCCYILLRIFIGVYAKMIIGDKVITRNLQDGVVVGINSNGSIIVKLHSGKSIVTTKSRVTLRS